MADGRVGEGAGEAVKGDRVRSIRADMAGGGVGEGACDAGKNPVAPAPRLVCQLLGPGPDYKIEIVGKPERKVSSNSLKSDKRG